MTGLHTLMCSKRPPTPEEQLRARVAALEGNLRAIATCFEDLHAKSNAEEYTDTGEVWEMICTLHRGIRNTLGPTPANVAAVDKELT
jgi:argininosuccinate lyase